VPANGDGLFQREMSGKKWKMSEKLPKNYRKITEK
jgi:hypothetical protein